MPALDVYQGSKSVPPLICGSPYQQELRCFKTGIISARSVSNKTCPLINTTGYFTLAFHSTEIGVSRSKSDSYGCSLVWTVAMLLTLSLWQPWVKNNSTEKRGKRWIWKVICFCFISNKVNNETCILLNLVNSQICCWLMSKGILALSYKHKCSACWYIQDSYCHGQSCGKQWFQNLTICSLI